MQGKKNYKNKNTPSIVKGQYIPAVKKVSDKQAERNKGKKAME
jgi:hypothetical protein